MDGLSLVLMVPVPVGKEVVEGDNNVFCEMVPLDGVEKGWVGIKVVQDIEVIDIV